MTFNEDHNQGQVNVKKNLANVVQKVNDSLKY